MTGADVRRLLTFDGGGIRGVLSLVWLEALEQRLQAPARTYVDTVAGTSIGSVLACAVAAGIPTAAVRTMVATHAARIFPKPWPWGGLRRPKYDPAPLRWALTLLFGRQAFGSLPRRTLIPVYDVSAQDAVVLDSHRAAHGELTVVDVCCASAAAQTYFPAVPLQVAERRLICVDGGTAANNPALVAWAAEEQRHPMAASVLVSFGTGQRCRAVDEATARTAGAIGWLRHDLINALLAGPSDLVDEACRAVVPRGRYFRLQTPLRMASDAMDDASPTNLVALASEAEDYLATRGGDLVLDLAADALLSARREAAA